MRLTEMKLFEASDLYCGNCGENLGKDTENCNPAYCGNCGDRTRNPRGYNCGAPAQEEPKATPVKAEPVKASGKSNTVYLTVNGSIIARDIKSQGQRVAGFVATRRDGPKKGFVSLDKAKAWIDSIDKRAKK